MIKTGVYRHYKSNDEYMVMWFACHSETRDMLVLYQAMYDVPELTEQYWPQPYFVRPYEMFGETVEREWKIVPRFEWVREE